MRIRMGYSKKKKKKKVKSPHHLLISSITCLYKKGLSQTARLNSLESLKMSQMCMRFSAAEWIKLLDYVPHSRFSIVSRRHG